MIVAQVAATEGRRRLGWRKGGVKRRRSLAREMVDHTGHFWLLCSIVVDLEVNQFDLDCPHYKMEPCKLNLKSQIPDLGPIQTGTRKNSVLLLQTLKINYSSCAECLPPSLSTHQPPVWLCQHRGQNGLRRAVLRLRRRSPRPRSRVPSETLVNRSLSLGYEIQGDAGLPGDPGQPMINGIVEFVGFSKGNKGLQVCWTCDRTQNRSGQGTERGEWGRRE